MTESPWKEGGFSCDLDRLAGLLSVCSFGTGRWASQEGGLLGKALDLWTADELRRAGYEPDAVWPRTNEPRVVPAAVARAIRKLSKKDQQSPLLSRIVETAGSSTPTVFGEFFPKQVDVLVADWDRGVELLISTKAMTGSYANNIKNRWEEFVGDLRNLRGRHPLAALGVLFMADRSISEPQNKSAYARLLEMLRKLRMPSPYGPAYDATGLVLALPVRKGKAQLDFSAVPTDLHPDQFFNSTLKVALERLPAAERTAARRLYGEAQLPTAELQAKPMA